MKRRSRVANGDNNPWTQRRSSHNQHLPIGKVGIKQAYGWQSEIEKNGATTPTFKAKSTRASSVLKKRPDTDFESDDRQILRQRIRHMIGKRKSRQSEKMKTLGAVSSKDEPYK